MSADLNKKILAVIREHNAIRSSKIAEILGEEKTLINSILYSANGLRGVVQQNKKYEWSLKDSASRGRATQGKSQNTPLSHLSQYYLDCINYGSDLGVSVYQKSKFSKDYLELNTIHFMDSSNSKEKQKTIQEIADFIRKKRKEKSHERICFYFGYPLALRRYEGAKWSGCFVEPLILFQITEDNSNPNIFEVNQNSPNLNFNFLKNFSLAESSNVLTEALEIFEELGLVDTDEIELDEVFQRLQIVRRDWPWKDELDPVNLSCRESIENYREQGIYNKAVVIMGKASDYTRGLETELGKFLQLKEEDYQSTVLGKLIRNNFKSGGNVEDQSLLEVLPLNTEQRDAVLSSLTNELTIITGPPGTGKSQVITSLLINAAWKNKKVLFASKNNKAVQVVESRVNGLGARPILLRQGRNEYQKMLVQYLGELLSYKTTSSDKQEYEQAKNKQMAILDRRENLESQINAIVEKRNEVDKLEQGVEGVREKYSESQIEFIKTSDMTRNILEIYTALEILKENSKKCEKPSSFFSSLFWEKKKIPLFENLNSSLNSLRNKVEFAFSRTDMFSRLGDNNLHSVNSIVSEINLFLDDVSLLNKYFTELSQLTSYERLEGLQKKLLKLLDETLMNSERLWKNWLKIQASNLGPENRRLLNEYSTVLNLIMTNQEKGEQTDRKIWARYYQLFPKVVEHLPCWSVTALQASKLPFVGNFFDILVIDEASQCDIASALPLLFRARNLVIIGDPKQLKHIPGISNRQDQQLMTKHKIFEEYLQWSFSQNSLFDLPLGLSTGENIINLRDHHRSHSDIISFSNKFFYGETLRVATNHQDLIMLDEGTVVRWVDCIGNMSKPSTGSYINRVEAEKVLSHLRELVIDKGYIGSVGVVSPFQAQAKHIRDLVERDKSLSSILYAKGFICDTVHRFQGDEKDLIIFSPTVSRNVTNGALNWLRGNGNLFNVAITRARSALHVIGDKSECLQSGIEYLVNFVNYENGLATQRLEREPSENRDFGPIYPNLRSNKFVSSYEKQVYEALYKHGIKSTPQFAVEKYVLDLAIIIGQSKLNIEIDGKHYHSTWTGELKKSDQIRNQRMFELGWDVKRFWVYEVRDKLESCIEEVKQWISTASSSNKNTTETFNSESFDSKNSTINKRKNLTKKSGNEINEEKELSIDDYFKIENFKTFNNKNPKSKFQTREIFTNEIIKQLRLKNKSENNLLNHGFPLTLEETDEVIKKYKQGLTLTELEKYFQRNEKRIEKVLKNNGISLKM